MSKIKPDYRKHKAHLADVPEITISVIMKKIKYTRKIQINSLLTIIKKYDDYEITKEDLQKYNDYMLKKHYLQPAKNIKTAD